jgi:serine-type D-Ala-D-Ala carboxypeptidase (penicillin-binding protein 5/6)
VRPRWWRDPLSSRRVGRSATAIPSPDGIGSEIDSVNAQPTDPNTSAQLSAEAAVALGDPAGTPAPVVTVPEVPPSWGTPVADAPLRTGADAGGQQGAAAGNGAAAMVAAAPPTTAEASVGRQRRRFRRSGRPQHRRDRPRRRLVLAVLAAVVVLIAAAGGVVAVRLQAASPIAVVRPEVPSAITVPGASPTISWPTGVEAAYTIPAFGVSDESGAEMPQSIASVTKLMTADVVLHDHPLSPGQSGPSITITSNDVGIYENDVASGETNLEVQVGEVLSELQLLEGMLVHSANNYADLLAVWDAGTTAAFVAKMNSTAASLGMTQTSYTDPSGYSPSTMSTAADQLKVAAVDMAIPLFAQIVDMRTVTLPVAGTVGSYTPLLGLDDVIGVKSGFTDAAGGCDVLALLHTIDGQRVVVLAAVFGYRTGVDVLDPAGLEALSVARSAMSGVRVDEVVRAGQRIGTASAAGYSVPVVAGGNASVVAWPGQQVTETFTLTKRPRSGAVRGSVVGSLAIDRDGQSRQVSVLTARRLPTPTFWQRVF